MNDLDTRHRLLLSLARVERPEAEACDEYRSKADLLAAELDTAMEAREDLESLIGPSNLAMMRDNHRNHARFMASFLAVFDPGALLETMLWVFRAYRSRGFSPTYWEVQLQTWTYVLREHLSVRSHAAIAPVYQWMLDNLSPLITLSETPDACGHSGEPPHPH